MSYTCHVKAEPLRSKAIVREELHGKTIGNLDEAAFQSKSYKLCGCRHHKRQKVSPLNVCTYIYIYYIIFIVKTIIIDVTCIANVIEFLIAFSCR